MNLKIIIILFCGFHCCFSQEQTKLDSLNLILKSKAHDTTLAHTYVAVTEQLFASNPDTIIPVCNKAIAIIETGMSGAGAAERRSFMGTKAAALNNIAYVHFIRGNIEKAIELFENALHINEEAGIKKEVANCLSNLGAIHDQQARPAVALGYLLRALKIQKEINAVEGIAYSLNNIAAIYDRQGQVEKTLEALQEALVLHESRGNKHGASTVLNNLGALHVKQGNSTKALELYQKSLAMRREIDDKIGIATCLHNIGYVYDVLNQKEKALDYNLQGLIVYSEIKDVRGVANSLHNIAAIYEKTGKNKEAIEMYRRAINIYDSIGDKRGLSNSLNNTGLYLIAHHKPAEARVYAVKALKAAMEGGYIEPIRSAYFCLSKADSALGDFNSALSNYKNYIFYRDSVSNEQTRKLAIKKTLQYEYERKEEALRFEQLVKTARHAEELKEQRIIKWQVAGGAGSVLLFSALLFNRRRLKQKHSFQKELMSQQKLQAGAVMEAQEMERKRIAEDIHDSLGHLLSTVKFNLQVQDSASDQVKNSLSLLNQASEEIKNITFNLMPKTLEEQGLRAALEELAYRINTSAVLKVNLAFYNTEKFVLDNQSQFNIYRIVQEAVNNIMKHANANEINIQLIGQDDHLSIMIEDDGKGFVPGEKREGRGLKNIVTRSLWLKGNINIDSTPGKGTTIITEIPF